MNLDEFQKTYSKLVKEWHKDNGSLPLEIKTGSKKIIKWTCSLCNHEWKTRLQHRTLAKSGCPRCSKKWKRLPNQQNSLAFLRPELANEVCDKNILSELCVSSNKKISWKCVKCQEQWITTILNRTSGKQGCPFCAGRKIRKENSVLSKHPDLCKEWKDDKNPNSFGPFSNIKVNWECSVCLHNWKSTINNRVRGRGCPICRYKHSKPHLRIRSILKSRNIKFSEEHRINECRDINPLPFDFAIFKQNKLILIEYQGEQHYQPFYGIPHFIKTVFHDQIKFDFCQKNNIELHQIPFTEDLEKEILKIIL